MKSWGERERWLTQYMLKEACGVDVMNTPFSDAYIEFTGAKYKVTNYGAFKCRQLGEDLARMHREGRCTRFRHGLGANWMPGFPTWVWSYNLTSYAREAFSKLPAEPGKE